jgi:Domain of unknown function (DUF4123)
VSVLADHLFAEQGTNVFAILDGASIEGLLDMLYQHEPEFICLYRGELEPDIAEVAPYLVRMEPQSAFTDWLLARGWGNHWGVFAVSRADLTAMRHHFRRFLTVHGSEGTPMLFRYYDPRVLRVYLPTCNSQELGSFFGPVLNYTMEGNAAVKLIQFRLDQGALVQEHQNLLQEV